MTVRTRIALLGITALAVTALLAPAGPTGAAPAALPMIAEPPNLSATLVRAYDAFDANQGIAVDRQNFYVVDNRSITKHARSSGAPSQQFYSDAGGPLVHMDSGVVVKSKLYAAHSNYDESPMENSVEVFDVRTMRHVATHSFGIERGSLTWLDRHDGAWWAGFANYDVVPDGETRPYGGTDNTQVVKMDDQFRVTQSWTIPRVILDRFRPMSNSGGSWGPDGRLWLTGHDLPEAYVMTLPAAGSELAWIATVHLPGVEGQGIAWDRSDIRPTLWAIKRSTKQALRFAVLYREISTPANTAWHVYGPGEFRP
jgi:hypothetical protein